MLEWEGPAGLAVITWDLGFVVQGSGLMWEVSESYAEYMRVGEDCCQIP